MLAARPRPTQAPCFAEDDQRLVRRYVRRFSPPWLRGEEDDSVQMVLVRVLRANPTIEHRAAYLKRAAHTTVIDETRRKRHRTEVGMTTSVNRRMVNSMDLTPETQARGAEVGEEMLAAVAELCDNRQPAVRLYLEQLSVPEIAERLGQGRKQTANQLYRGLSDLRHVLQAKGITPSP